MGAHGAEQEQQQQEQQSPEKYVSDASAPHPHTTSSSSSPSASSPRRQEAAAAPDGSVIAHKYATGEWRHTRGQHIPEQYPTDREVASAVQQQVAASVETYRSYRQVAWHTAFVALYLLALYFQAASFQAGAVVSTLKAALLPDTGSPHMAFSGPDQVLAYLGGKFVRPVFRDPVCGDGRCEVPWEQPAWGPFGCQTDCGLNPNTTKVVVALNADFSGHPSISASALREQASWNLCLRDELRQQRGLPPLCWFQQDQVFEAVVESHIRAVSLVDGAWYIRLDGDLAGKVVGAVYDASAGESELVPIPLSQSWEACKVKKRRVPALHNSPTVRRLLSEFTLARQRSGSAGEQLLVTAAAAAVAGVGPGA